MRVLEAPPTVVPVTWPGVDIDRLAVITDATNDAVSIVAVIGVFSEVGRAQFPESSPAPNVAVWSRVTVPFSRRKVDVSPLKTQLPSSAPGMAVYVATWHTSLPKPPLIREHAAAHSVGLATCFVKMISVCMAAVSQRTSYSYRLSPTMLVTSFPSCSGQLNGSASTNEPGRPEAIGTSLVPRVVADKFADNPLAKVDVAEASVVVLSEPVLNPLDVEASTVNVDESTITVAPAWNVPLIVWLVARLTACITVSV
jgi:hypothetical protein